MTGPGPDGGSQPLPRQFAPGQPATGLLSPAVSLGADLDDLGDSDPALGRRAVDESGRFVSGHFGLELLAGVGHWLQFEGPGESSALLGEHMGRLGVGPNTT